jgi:hypothetical protein
MAAREERTGRELPGGGGDDKGGFDGGSSGDGGGISSIGAECIDSREQHSV